MRIFSRAGYSKERLPHTHVYNLLDNQLLLVLRTWGSSDYNQRFVDEITHYLSSAQADVEVTTPFDYHENISSLANRTRVALLLAHDLFYKTENKSEFSAGFEAMVLFSQRSELAWSGVGRFALDHIDGSGVNHLLQNGSDLDRETLLPAQLIGVEREIDISSGSVTFTSESKLVISSVYRAKLNFNTGAPLESLVETTGDGAYWFGVVSPD